MIRGAMPTSNLSVEADAWAHPRVRPEAAAESRPVVRLRGPQVVRATRGLAVSTAALLLQASGLPPGSFSRRLPHLSVGGQASPRSPDLSQPGESDIIQGIPTGVAEVRKAIQRVVVLASLSGTYYISAFIARLLLGQYSQEGSADELWSGLSQLIIELSIPACGYYGALYIHRILIFFFCGANLIFVVASIINFFRFIIRIRGTIDMCQDEQYSTARRDCEVMHSDSPARYLFLFSLVALTCFGCMSFRAGKMLYQGLGPGDALQLPFSSMPVVGEVISGPGSAEDGNADRVEALPATTNERPEIITHRVSENTLA